MKMFQYLSQKQVTDLMLLFCIADDLDKIINEWVLHKNMSKTEAKYIRTSRTYMNKFMEEIQARIPLKEKDKLIKRYSNFHLQIMDKWLLDKFQRDVEKNAQMVLMDRDVFTGLAYEVTNTKCRDCNKSHTTCKWHDVLYECLFPAAEQKPNCPYAYISDEVREQMQKEKELRELKRLEKKTGSKRSRKKKANRYDEDDEVIEYNFTPGGNR